MSELVVTPLNYAAALKIVTWRYPPPYDLYNLEEPVEAVLFLSRRDSGYYQLRDAGELVAFCCYGEEGQVPGGDYSAPALDIGLGLRPDLTGRGLGRRFLDAVLAFGSAAFAPATLRLTVAAFNTRAIRLYSAAGFVERARFRSTFSGREYLVMTQDESTASRARLGGSELPGPLT